jgi:hypothetical protein
MPIATDEQVQAFADQRVRPLCEKIREVVVLCNDLRVSIEDVYAHLVQANPTWVDSRTDVPNKITVNDFLAINTMAEFIKTEIPQEGEYAIVLQSCVRTLA